MGASFEGALFVFVWKGRQRGTPLLFGCPILRQRHTLKSLLQQRPKEELLADFGVCSLHCRLVQMLLCKFDTVGLRIQLEPEVQPEVHNEVRPEPEV